MDTATWKAEKCQKVLFMTQCNILFHRRLTFVKMKERKAWDEHTKIKSGNTLFNQKYNRKGTYHNNRMIQFHILIYKQEFTIIPMKEEKPKLKHNMEPSDVNTRVKTCNITRHFLQQWTCTGSRQPLLSSWQVSLPPLQGHSCSLCHLSPWKLLIFSCAKEFLQRVKCDSGFSQGFKDTYYSFYQSQNMVEIQHELSFLSISLEKTWTESYNTGTPSSYNY